MRKIPINYIKPGMIVGKHLYDKQNALLLSKGHVLSQREINRIKSLKYQAIYIAGNNTNQTGPTEVDDISEALRNKAVMTVKELFASISNEKKLNKQAISNARSVVENIVSEIVSNKNMTYPMTDMKLFDDYTYYHSVNVMVNAVVLGFSMGLSKIVLYKLGLGALMHDIGKIFVPKEILEKQDRLTEEEFAIIKKHSKDGYDYLKKVESFPSESNLAVLTHHEKFNGFGYPDGIMADQIPIFGRILAVADVFDALISDRPYRKAMMPAEAVEYIVGGSGEQFDPKVVDAFIEKISPYPIGTHVVLSNGQKAIVVKNRPKFGLRPKVMVIGSNTPPLYYDLSEEALDITITKISYD